MKSFKILILFCFCIFSVPAHAQNRQAVLIQGNSWQAGIPGFGSNVFSALFGEYQVETVVATGGTTADGSFIVRASREPLQFATEYWMPWTDVNNALQRTEDGFLLIACPFNGPNNMGAWTLVFQFPQGVSGLDIPSINRLIRAWTGRFNYFLTMVKGFSDVSLPAVVNF